MLQEKTILVVVPARGGSKGIPLKNIYPLAGKPLLAYTAEIVQQLDSIDRAVVSTDHEDIARVARSYGLDVPFYRPDFLSGDRISDLDVLTHALEEVERQDQHTYDIIVMLQPTSPMRTAEQVMNTITRLLAGGYDAVWTVSLTDSKAHPLKQFVIIDNHLEYYDPAGSQIIARQQLHPVYHRNGVAYAITRTCLLEKRSIKGDFTGVVIINEPVVNIDTEFDIRFAEFLLKTQNGRPSFRNGTQK